MTDTNNNSSMEFPGVKIPETLVTEVYKDLAKPATQEIGELVAKPFHFANWIIDRGKEYCLNNNNTQKLQDEVQEKLQSISQEDICEPSKTIAIPAIIANSYTDEDYLRSLYANLITNSMNRHYRGHAHPSFVEIIKQLTSEEALILKRCGLLTTPLPACHIRFQKLSSFKNRDHLKLAPHNIIRHSQEGVTLYHYYMPSIQSGPIKEYEIMIDNFIRLNLITCHDDEIMTEPNNAYSQFYKDPFNANLELQYKESKPNYELAHIMCYLAPTKFGERFYEICVK